MVYTLPDSDSDTDSERARRATTARKGKKGGGAPRGGAHCLVTCGCCGRQGQERRGAWRRTLFCGRCVRRRCAQGQERRGAWRGGTSCLVCGHWPLIVMASASCRGRGVRHVRCAVQVVPPRPRSQCVGSRNAKSLALVGNHHYATYSTTFIAQSLQTPQTAITQAGARATHRARARTQVPWFESG